MQKSRIFLTMFIGLFIFAIALFYLKVGWLLNGEVNHEAERMGYCFDVATEQTDNKLFVAAGHRGMHILKLLQGKLQYVSTYYDGGYYRNLKVRNHRAFIADSKRGLVVLDLSRETPVTSWVQSRGKAYGLAIENNTAYVAAHKDGLQIFDISNPDAPLLLSAVVTGGYAWDVWVQNNFAYIADFDKGLIVVDVSSATESRRVGMVTWAESYPTAEIVRGQGNGLYVAASKHGLVIIDISDPAHPVVASKYRPLRLGKAEGLAVWEGLVYLAMGSRIKGFFTIENGLHIVDVTNPYSPLPVGKVNFPAWVEGVHVAGDFAYVANTYKGVRSINISNPGNPFLVDSFTSFPLTINDNDRQEK